MQAYNEMCNSMFRPEWMRMRVIDWDESTPSTPWGGPRLPGVMAFRDDVEPELKSALAITDAKSLYDALKRQPKGRELLYARNA